MEQTPQHQDRMAGCQLMRPHCLAGGQPSPGSWSSGEAGSGTRPPWQGPAARRGSMWASVWMAESEPPGGASPPGPPLRASCRPCLVGPLAHLGTIARALGGEAWAPSCAAAGDGGPYPFKGALCLLADAPLRQDLLHTSLAWHGPRGAVSELSLRSMPPMDGWGTLHGWQS